MIVTGSMTIVPVIETTVIVNYKIQSLDHKGNGVLVFSEPPVNMQYIKANFTSLFIVYYTDFNNTLNPRNQSVMDFIVHDWSDYSTIAFTVNFFEPYLLGLLQQANDTLHIDLNTAFSVDASMLFYDTEDGLASNH